MPLVNKKSHSDLFFNAIVTASLGTKNDSFQLQL